MTAAIPFSGSPSKCWPRPNLSETKKGVQQPSRLGVSFFSVHFERIFFNRGSLFDKKLVFRAPDIGRGEGRTLEGAMEKRLPKTHRHHAGN